MPKLPMDADQLVRTHMRTCKMPFLSGGNTVHAGIPMSQHSVDPMSETRLQPKWLTAISFAHPNPVSASASNPAVLRIWHNNGFGGAFINAGLVLDFATNIRRSQSLMQDRSLFDTPPLPIVNITASKQQGVCLIHGWGLAA
ncbi:hypothetical protein, variant [Blastomyces dermatitidis ATCC 26199]|nr:hypothetical protein BDFG_00802 [Blastomyces dermatitidis ATCC 26199]EQL37752.1 hypothetical protein, variant [Blastomyces dermatitidis ATCC 26199]